MTPTQQATFFVRALLYNQRLVMEAKHEHAVEYAIAAADRVVAALSRGMVAEEHQPEPAPKYATVLDELKDRISQWSGQTGASESWCAGALMFSMWRDRNHAPAPVAPPDEESVEDEFQAWLIHFHKGGRHTSTAEERIGARDALHWRRDRVARRGEGT